MQRLDYLPTSAKSFVPPLPVPVFNIVRIIFTTVPMTSQLPILGGLLVRVNGYVKHYGRIMFNGLVLCIGAV